MTYRYEYDYRSLDEIDTKMPRCYTQKAENENRTFTERMNKFRDNLPADLTAPKWRDVAQIRSFEGYVRLIDALAPQGSDFMDADSPWKEWVLAGVGDSEKVYQKSLEIILKLLETGMAYITVKKTPVPQNLPCCTGCEAVSCYTKYQKLWRSRFRRFKQAWKKSRDWKNPFDTQKQQESKP